MGFYCNSQFAVASRPWFLGLGAWSVLVLGPVLSPLFLVRSCRAKVDQGRWTKDKESPLEYYTKMKTALAFSRSASTRVAAPPAISDSVEQDDDAGNQYDDPEHDHERQRRSVNRHWLFLPESTMAPFAGGSKQLSQRRLSRKQPR